MKRAATLLVLLLLLVGILAAIWLGTRPDVELPSIATNVQHYSGALSVAKEVYFEAIGVDRRNAIFEFFQLQAKNRGWTRISPTAEHWSRGEWSSYQSSSNLDEVVHQRLLHWRKGLWSIRVAIRYRSTSGDGVDWGRQEVTVFVVPFELLG